MTEGWSLARLDELGNGQRPVLKAGPFGSSITKATYVQNGYKVYGQQEVVSGDAFSGSYYIDQELFEQLSTCDVEPGDVLITMMGTVGRVLLVPEGAERGIINPRLMRLTLDSQKVDPEYACYFLSSSAMQRLMERRAHGGTMPGLNAEAIASIRLPLPPLPEQRKIAEILRTWDEAIDACERLIERKQKRLDGLRESLIFGRMRTNGAHRNWKPRRLAEVTCELTGRNADNTLGRESVMGVTKARGIVPMREATVADDIGRYKRLPPHAFAYNPMRINVGSIAMNDHGQDVLVSPDYVVFTCIQGKLDPDYLNNLRRTPWWMHYINSGGSGSVRQRTYYDDLAAMQLPLPDIAEQTAISEILNTAQSDLSWTQKQMEFLSQQKRGLMQKLLTGDWRVKVGGN